MTTNYRTRRVEAIRQNVRRHQQAAEKQENAERATPAYLKHHGRISASTPETFIRRRTPVASTLGMPSEKSDLCAHASPRLFNHSGSRTKIPPPPTCHSAPESPAAVAHTVVTVPDRPDTFDEYYDLTPQYMVSYRPPEVRAEPELDPRTAGLDEGNTLHAFSQDVSPSTVQIANPYSTFPAPIGTPKGVANLASPAKDRRQGLFRRAKAAAQPSQQPVPSRLGKTARGSSHDSATQGSARAPYVEQPSQGLRSPYISPYLGSENSELPHTGNSRGTNVSASLSILESGAVRMRAMIDMALCIFALSLFVLAFFGTMSTFATVITTPARW
ncbi:hypothetical protein BST61_g3317 [Cercospora zeina]